MVHGLPHGWHRPLEAFHRHRTIYPGSAKVFHISVAPGALHLFFKVISDLSQFQIWQFSHGRKPKAGQQKQPASDVDPDLPPIQPPKKLRLLLIQLQGPAALKLAFCFFAEESGQFNVIWYEVRLSFLTEAASLMAKLCYSESKSYFSHDYRGLCF